MNICNVNNKRSLNTINKLVKFKLLQFTDKENTFTIISIKKWGSSSVVRAGSFEIIQAVNQILLLRYLRPGRGFESHLLHNLVNLNLLQNGNCGSNPPWKFKNYQ